MRTVLAVERQAAPNPNDVSQFLVKAVRTPFNVAGVGTAQPFTLSTSELENWSTPDAVRLRGELIRDRLGAHLAVKQLLVQLHQSPGSYPLFLLLKENDGDAEAISWETLCNPINKFFALDKRSPIGRIADPISSNPLQPPTLRLPIKVMAIISAFGVNGQEKEWQNLRDAIAAVAGPNLRVELKLLVGSPALRKEIEDTIAAGETWIQVSHIEKTGKQIMDEVTKWKPNILHFFCHGYSDAGEQWLELATASDYADPTTTSGSVKIGTDLLESASRDLTDPWLLTLNCCDSGKATEDLQSIAQRLVSAGFPAVVAMLEPIDASDGHEFTRAFYLSAFGALDRTSKALAASPHAPFEWIDAMYDARAAISSLHGNPNNTKQWVLPLLYVRGVDPVNFLRPHNDLADDARRDFKQSARIVAEFLSMLPDDTSETARKTILERGLAGVPKRFWPDTHGSFTQTS